MNLTPCVGILGSDEPTQRMTSKMAENRLVFRVHAIQRMFERGITEKDIQVILKNGKTIKSYPDDMPYPSRLVPG